jgi:hypothetical protein
MRLYRENLIRTLLTAHNDISVYKNGTIRSTPPTILLMQILKVEIMKILIYS